MTDYKSMFEQAVRTLAAIDEVLGIGDDGCGDPDQTLTAIAELKEEVQMLRATVVDSAADVIAWCDKNPPAGDALYCIARLRHALATVSACRNKTRSEAESDLIALLRGEP